MRISSLFYRVMSGPLHVKQEVYTKIVHLRDLYVGKGDRVISTTKLVSFWDLRAFMIIYLMSNLESCIDHLSILSAMFGLPNIYFTGWSVRTTLVWARK